MNILGVLRKRTKKSGLLIAMLIFSLAVKNTLYINAETNKILYIARGGEGNYGKYFAWIGQVDYKKPYSIEILSNITNWLIVNNYDLIIIEDIIDQYGDVATKTMQSISIYVNNYGKSLLILYGSYYNDIDYLGGFGAVVKMRPVPGFDMETSLITNHEVTTGVWKLYVSRKTLSIHKGFLTPLAFAPPEWWETSNIPVAGAVGSYGNGKVAYMSEDLLRDSEIADNNRLIINIVNWLLGEDVGPDEIKIELKTLEEEMLKITNEISRLNDIKTSLEAEINRIQAQEDELIETLPKVVSLKEDLSKLEASYSELIEDQDSLKSNLEEYQSDYEELKSDYEDLMGKYEGQFRKSYPQELLYVFVITTLIFVITTIYFASRK